MPELPDVEGFRRVVGEHATGNRVRSVRVLDDGVVHGSARELVGAVRGQVVGPPSRRGKWLCVPVGSGGDAFPRLLVHFGMTGSFEWSAEVGADHRHDRVVFELGAGALRYRDMRKLAGFWLARTPSDVERALGELGPDAACASRTELRSRLTRTRRGLKAALMDQAVVAGLGNLCVDEILWRSRLRPALSTCELTTAQWSRLHARMGSVLRASCRAGCVPSRSSWLTGHRDDRPGRCPRCGGQLRVERCAGRTTAWCPSCQRD